MVIAGLTAKFKDSKPIKWFLDRLVIQPATEALDRHIDHRLGDTVARAVGPLTNMLRDVHAEVFPNSGSSLRDAVDRTEGTAIHTADEVEGLKMVVANNMQRLGKVEGQVEVLVAKD